jgi:hypothetical protein
MEAESRKEWIRLFLILGFLGVGAGAGKIYLHGVKPGYIVGVVVGALCFGRAGWHLYKSRSDSSSTPNDTA